MANKNHFFKQKNNNKKSLFIIKKDYYEVIQNYDSDRERYLG